MKIQSQIDRQNLAVKEAVLVQARSPRGLSPRQNITHNRKGKYKATTKSTKHPTTETTMSSTQNSNAYLPGYSETNPIHIRAGSTSADFPEKGDFAIPNVSPKTAHVRSSPADLIEVTPYSASTVLRFV
jgi:hypothetical protein